jgi:hypothetical protein
VGGGFGTRSLEGKTPPLSEEGGPFKTRPLTSWSPAAEVVMVVEEVVAMEVMVLVLVLVLVELVVVCCANMV